jgi:hypothetical protein
MSPMLTFLFAIALFAASSASLAEDMVTFYGVGTNSCGAFLAAERAAKNGVRQRDSGNTFYPERSMYQEWLSGYVSSFNAQNVQRSGVKMVNTDVEGLMAWVRSYCEKNPTKQVLVAVNALVEAESRTR